MVRWRVESQRRPVQKTRSRQLLLLLLRVGRHGATSLISLALRPQAAAIHLPAHAGNVSMN